MNNIKKYPVTYTLLALCILTYIGTTLLFSIDMSAMQGLACEGLIHTMFKLLINTIV